MHIKHVVFSIIVIKLKIMFMLIIAIINIDKFITSKLIFCLSSFMLQVKCNDQNLFILIC